MTALIAAVFLLLQVLVKVECDNALPSGYEMYPGDNTAIKIHTNLATWDEAQERCVSEGAHLAVATSSVKIKHIQNLSGRKTKWIGIHRPTGGKKAYWVRVDTGLPVRSLPWGDKPAKKEDNCAATWNVDGKIVKSSCTDKLPFACEISGPCSVSIRNDLPDPQPLVLRPGSGGGFRKPDDAVGTLKFTAGEKVRLVCTGKDNKFKNLEGTQWDVLATCVNGKTFSVSGVAKAFRKLACSLLPLPDERIRRKTCLGGRYTDVELGFGVGDEFLTIINACHDENRKETLYTKFTLVKEISGFQSGFPRPRYWNQTSFWPNIVLDDQYKLDTQVKTIGTLLGSVEEGKRYIKNNQYSLSHGHLVAKSDLLYGSQQNVTFSYVNSAPQWQNFNGGNWNDLEKDVKAFASGSQQDLTVYTGVHGIAQLPNVNGVQTDLYFRVDSNGVRSIPIPKFFWKVIYNEKTKLGTAFVGVNNLYLPKITNEYRICTDISSQIRRLTWKPNDKALGISYACTVDSLRKVVTNIPAFKVNGVLA